MKRKLILLLISAFFLFFCLSWLSNYPKFYSYPPANTLIKAYFEFKNTVNDFKQIIKIYKAGKDEYIKKTLSSQYLTPKNAIYEKNIIETSSLPLSRKDIYLGCYKSYTREGGALGIVEKSLVIMDKAGSFYMIKDGCVDKLDLPVIPNHIEDFILYSRYRGFDGGSLRAHSFVYDKKSSQLYVAYQRYIDKSTTKLTISSLKLNKFSAALGASWHDIWIGDPELAINQSHASGGKLLLVGNSLFLSTGPGPEFFENGKLKSNAQNPQSTLGKIIKINLAYKKSEIFSMGHRNPQGLVSFSDNELMEVEHGPQGGDEINLIIKGGNYGWPDASFGTDYGKYSATFESLNRPLIKGILPIFSYVPSIGISSITFVDGFHKKWNGDFLIGSLKAQSIFHIKYEFGRVIYSEPIWIGSRIRDLIVFNGKIYLLTEDGYLASLIPSIATLEKNQKGDGLKALSKVMEPCIKCHSFSQSNPTNAAPSLANIFNKKIASDIFEHYSEALRNKKGSWTESDLKQYISNPESFAPGSSMPNLYLNEDEVNAIVEFLKSN
jgi:cytochrome c2